MLERAPRRRGRPLAGLGYLIAILAGLALAVAAQCWYLREQVLDQSAFATRVTRVATDPGVRSTIVGEISDVVSSKVGISAGTIAPTVSEAVGSKSFKSVLDASARGFNAALFHGATGDQALNVALGGLLKSSSIPAGALNGASVDLLNARDGRALRYTNDAAKVIRVLCVALLVLAALALLFALLLAGRLLRVLGFAALAVAVAGAVMLPVLSHLRAHAIHALLVTQGLDPLRTEAFATSVWNGMFAPMHTLAVVCLIGGAIVGAGSLVLSALASGMRRTSYS